MNKNFPQPGFRRSVSAFLFPGITIFFFASSLHADNIFQKVSGPTSKSSRSPAATDRSLAGPVAGKGLRPAGAESFAVGFEPGQAPSWAKWEPLPEFDVQGPESYASWTPAGPATDLKSLDAYKISPNENPLTVALKIDDMIQGLSPAVVNSGVNDITQDNLSQTILLVFKI